MKIWVVLLVTWCSQILLLPSTILAQDCGLGDCISIHQCPLLSSLLQQIRAGRGPPNGLNRLRQAVCANDGSGVRVCCPQTTINPTTPNRRLHPKFPSNCGLSSTFGKIVNGEDASLGSWPWMVIFRAKIRNGGTSCGDDNLQCSGWAANGECQRNSAYMNVNCRRSCNTCPSGTGESHWICGGVLITQQYVLTAAHCFKSNFEIEFVRIGEFDLSKDPDISGHLRAPKPQDIRVERVIRHPNYKSPCSKCNDIALVKLARPAQLYTIYVQPICLPSNPDQTMGFPVSAFQRKVGWATGWGVTDAADILSTTGSDILQQVNLTIQERQFCRERKAMYPDGRMILCAGQGDGRDVCRADSGGPLMLSDQFLKKWYVVGITSFGSTFCGARDAQGIFTSVHHYIDWIHQNIQ